MNLIDNIQASLGSADYDFLIQSVVSNMTDETSVQEEEAMRNKVTSLKEQIASRYEDRETLSFEKTRIDRIIQELERGALSSDVEMRLFIVLLSKRSNDLQDSIGSLSPTELVEEKSKLTQRIKNLVSSRAFIVSLNEASFISEALSKYDLDKAAKNMLR